MTAAGACLGASRCRSTPRAAPAPTPPALASLAGLERLALGDNAVVDVASLGGLRVLALSGNRVADAWPLGALERLEYLGLADNAVWGPLQSLARLGRLIRLRWVWLADNPLRGPARPTRCCRRGRGRTSRGKCLRPRNGTVIRDGERCPGLGGSRRAGCCPAALAGGAAGAGPERDGGSVDIRTLGGRRGADRGAGRIADADGIAWPCTGPCAAPSTST